MKCELCGRKAIDGSPYKKGIKLRESPPYKAVCQFCVPEETPPMAVEKPKTVESLTTDPNHPGLKKIKENGQQETYIVLSEEERAKGFVRPVRQSYVHVGERPKYPIVELTAEEKEKHKKWGYTHYEKYPDSELPLLGRHWTEKQLNSGCKTLTTMSLPIAETYARNPKYYGSTFCCGCGKHLPVAEFVWDGTDERLGS